MATTRVYRGIITANAFSFFCSSGQACLMPFLSLYFLYLGLNPFQTGLLLGVKALTAGLSSAFWTQCLTTTPRRLKFVLVLSLLVLILSHFVMVLMPSMDAEKSASFCGSEGDISSSSPFLNASSTNCSDSTNTTSCNVTSATRMPGNFTTAIRLNLTTKDYLNTTSTNTNTGYGINNSKPNLHSTTSSPLKSKPKTTRTTTKYATTSTTSKVPTDYNKPKDSKEEDISKAYPVLSQGKSPDFGPAKTSNRTPISTKVDDYWYRYNANNEYRKNRKRRHGGESHEPSAIGRATDAQITSTLFAHSHHTTSTPSDGSVPVESTASPVFHTTVPGPKKPDIFHRNVQSIQSQVFSAMLVLVVISEMFSSPAEPVAEELYVTFLESNDQSLVRRRTTSCWSSLGGSLTPWVVVIIIDHLPCHVPPFGSQRILFHFWMFAIIHFLTFLFSICFPSSTNDGVQGSRSSNSGSSHNRTHYHHGHHYKKWANLVRGLRVIVSDGRGVLSAITLFVIGFVQGFITTFLPWAIHDLVTDGSEFYIGAAIGLAAAGDLVARLFGDWVCRKVGHALCIFFGLLVTAVRVTLYGFLVEPWLALIGESAHLFSTALVASAVSDHPAFRVIRKSDDGETGNGNSKKQKHARNCNSLTSFTAAESMSVQCALRLLRSGFGFAIGCCVAGLLITRYQMQLAFCSAGGTALAWCLVFAVLYPCCRSRCLANKGSSRKKRTSGLASSLLVGRYKKLSRRDDEDEDEDDYDEDVSSEEEESDWLDAVTRKQKS